MLDLAIIYFSVQWWETLHRGMSISVKSAPATASTVWAGLIAMAVGFVMYSVAVTLLWSRCIILEAEREAEWVAELGRLT